MATLKSKDDYLNDNFSPLHYITLQLQNLGLFPVSHLLLTVDVFSVTKNGNHLLYISDINVNQVGNEIKFTFKLSFISKYLCLLCGFVVFLIYIYKKVISLPVPNCILSLKEFS